MITIVIAGILVILMGLVFYLDLTKYLIPNWLVGLVLLMWPVMLFFSGASIDWQVHLMVMAGAFAAGFIIFALKIMGGGDVKLLTACCLWTGKTALFDFVVLTAVLGGVLAILLLVGRYLAPWVGSKFERTIALPRMLTHGEPVPYGLAIAAAFVILLWRGAIPGV